MYYYEGKKYTLPNLCKIFGKNYRTVRNRITRSGMSLEAALLTPLKNS